MKVDLGGHAQGAAPTFRWEARFNLLHRTTGGLSALTKIGKEHRISAASGSAMRTQLYSSTIHDPKRYVASIRPNLLLKVL